MFCVPLSVIRSENGCGQLWDSLEWIPWKAWLEVRPRPHRSEKRLQLYRRGVVNSDRLVFLWCSLSVAGSLNKAQWLAADQVLVALSRSDASTIASLSYPLPDSSLAFCSLSHLYSRFVGRWLVRKVLCEQTFDWMIDFYTSHMQSKTANAGM